MYLSKDQENEWSMALISRLFMDTALYPPIEMRGAPVYMTEIIRSILCEHVQYITSVTCDYVRYLKLFWFIAFNKYLQNVPETFP